MLCSVENENKFYSLEAYIFTCANLCIFTLKLFKGLILLTVH